MLVVSSAVLLLALSACQAAVGARDYGAAPHTISVSGQGQVYLTPDMATIFIGVHSQNENVTVALQENNAKAQAIADALKNMGVDPKDIQTSNFNVYPQQQYGPNGETTDLIYAVDNTVNVTVRDLTKMGQLLDTVVSSGANNINGISFDVKDREKALSQARELAIKNARQQAEEVATAAGVTLGNVYSINIYTSGNPTPIYDAKGGMAAAQSSVPVSAGQMLITVDVNMQFEIQ
jgi:hypothetical protein